MSSGDVNKEWASNLSGSTLEKLRLHLSWTMGINAFEWDHLNVGEQTLITLKKLGVLHSLMQGVIVHEGEPSSSVDHDYILC